MGCKMNEVAERAVQAALNCQMTYCKFLAANDTGVTGAHQAGIYVAKPAVPILFDEPGERGSNKDRYVKVTWQDGTVTDSRFIYYGKGTRDEYRITRFGRGFPFLQPEYTGALFVFVKDAPEDYQGFFLNTEEEIDAFLGAFGLSPAETNDLVDMSTHAPDKREQIAIERFIAGLDADFPETEEMAAAARAIQSKVFRDDALIAEDPDRMLLNWSNVEYKLFCALEQDRYGDAVKAGFGSMDEFVELANKVLNRRKSRAGKSLEHHLSAIFDAYDLEYDSQAHTEGSKRPDFLFPSAEAYHNASYPIGKLVFLGAKTTCKDRWRQVLNEADRFKGRDIYLCTLQQGVSETQMDEMQSEHVTLVVPAAYHKSFPRACRDRLWTIKNFVSYVQEVEGK